MPKKPNISLFDKKTKEVKSNVKTLQDYKNELKTWKPEHRSFSDYEKLCIDILEKLFNDELTMWKEQTSTEGSLYRYDLICKIKDNVSEGGGKYSMTTLIIYILFLNLKIIAIKSSKVKYILQKNIYILRRCAQ